MSASRRARACAEIATVDNREDEEEEIETKERTLEKGAFLAALALEARRARTVNGSLRTTIEVQFLVDEAGGLAITAVEADGGEKVTLAIAPAA